MPIRGWKLCHLPRGKGFFSLFTASSWFIKNFNIGEETRVDEAPLFFFGDDLTAADLVTWGLHAETTFEMALLRVEAAGSPLGAVRTMRYCADEEGDIPAFWATVLGGEQWPLEKSYTCPPKTLSSPALTPLAVAWVGRRKGSDSAELEVEIAAAMERARAGDGAQPVIVKPSLWMPVAARGW